MSPAILADTSPFDDLAPCKKQSNQGTSDGLAAASVNDLPVELLIQIFVHCSHSSGSELAQITIYQVCRFWRDILLNTPHAWQHVFLDDKRRPIRASHEQARVWLHRSQHLPIDIHITLDDADNLLPLVSPLIAYVRRWRWLTIAGKIQEVVDFTSLSHEGSLAIMDSLTVVIKGLDGPTFAGIHEQPEPFHTFRSSEPFNGSSTIRRFHSILIHAEVVKLPIPQHLSTTHLRHLIIRESSLDVVPDPARLINFLLCCPELRMFHYCALPHEPSPPMNRIPLPIVHLPHLRSLALRSTCAVRAILSHIDAPCLRELYLEHTNMEFPLQHAAAFTTEPEEGDSDDEASDYSQSPYSDHATGMGLRSLLSRSNPPLQVLEMDYADMRTKDFLWCFDRLNTLEEFRIVASDMSDKVINMLAPFRASRWPRSFSSFSQHGDCGSEGDGDYMQEQYHVCMPRLTALELWNCQRLTGNAVVAALRARVRYTDEVADRNTYSKLSEVAIMQCADFLQHHALMLSPVLGMRLRISA